MGTKLSNNRIKPKYNGKNKSKTTKEDKDYLQWLQEQNFACFVCGKRNKIEFHHIKEHSTDRKNHKRLIPLCGAEHHRCGELSPHGNPKRWRETFSMELQNDFADEIYAEYTKNTL